MTHHSNYIMRSIDLTFARINFAYPSEIWSISPSLFSQRVVVDEAFIYVYMCAQVVDAATRETNIARFTDKAYFPELPDYFYRLVVNVYSPVK